MAEPLSSFVKRRRPDWDALGKLLDRQQQGQLALADLRVLDRLYRRTTADLAHAQSFYPGTDAQRFVNQLCARAYGAIYQPPRERWAAVREFFRRGFPRTLRAELAYVRLSAFLFGLGLVVGAAVVLLDPSGAQLLVPEGIRQAVAEKKMWTDNLLSVMPPNVAASAILTNNLSVTIAAFALGAPLGLGTAFVLLNNGLHLGSVTALCLRDGMGGKLFDFIAAHGPVELSVIVIAGGAGLVLGHALLAPGELPRAVHVKRRARVGVQLVVGCAPFLALIGVVEGFISPGELFPTALKAALGLALFAAFWGYLLFTGRD